MKIKFILTACLLLLSLSACAKKDKSTKQYHLISNGCDTGEHSFEADNEEDAQKQMCEALRDDQVNGGCAADLRQERFKDECPGMNW